MTGLFTLTVLLAAGADPAVPDYAKDVKPILAAKCYACHGAVRQKAGLRLDAGQLVLKGAKRGPIVEPGKPEESTLIEAVIGKDRPRMPPEGEGEHLTEKELAVLTNWIKAGAKAPEEPIPDDPKNHWAYQLPKRPAVPGTGHPVDAFLHAERAKQKLTTNPEADRATLLRRVTIDLIGIPPTPAELHAFEKDTSPTAYEKVVDRLLASPLYGERWGRHWMDVWRYSDPFGLGEEYRYSQRHVWRWRDWIIESLNKDKGYDRMVVEMLAGDEVAPADRDTLRATGYLARNWYKFNRNVWLQDTVEYTAAGFLGMTLKCARCHDHKFDPVSQQDYYRFRAFFEPHDVRIDPVPGEPNTLKDGVARAFDAKPDAATYLFARGDERTPEKDRPLSPGVPGVVGKELQIAGVKFAPKDFAARLPEAADDAFKDAQAKLSLIAFGREAVKGGLKNSLKDAKVKLEQIEAGIVPKPNEVPAFLHDTFATRDKPWKVLSGDWAWDKDKLVCRKPSTFATVTLQDNHPAALMGRVRYKTTGGGIGSVGFSFDAAGNDFQAVYINANADPAVRPFHRVSGNDVYPPDGVVRHPVKFGDTVTIDFAVRGNLLNTWVNGTLKTVYRLPVARKAGTFAVWTHDATAEFYEVKLAALPDAVPLADKAGERLGSPIDATIVPTRAEAERAVAAVQAYIDMLDVREEIARSVLLTIHKRLAADRLKYAEAFDEAKWRPLATEASRAEKQIAVLRAKDAVFDQEREQHPDPKKLALAKMALDAATAAAAKDDTAYTPLLKMDPAGSTGRRLALANWIASRQNPLTARVAVNHVWLRHFGTPLVASVANFGLSGKKPTHPELLDWLAVEFMEKGWSMKHLHRLVVTSQAYRLTSRNADGPNKTADPENHWYWRMNPRRMEAEAVRDSLLAVAGQLDRTMGGPILDEKQGQTSRRRSVYFRFNAEYKMPFLDQFDAASPTECFERRESVVPQQSLALHNSVIALNASRELAKTLAKQSGDFVTAAYEAVLGRRPTAAERAKCAAFLTDQASLYKQSGKLTPFPGLVVGPVGPAADPDQRAREDLVHVLFNHNDFVTVR